jgi:hypothetical protein
MPRNGSGTYVLPPSNPVVSGTVIESEWANDTMADIANALSTSISYDGQTVPIANLQMGGFHHLNVSDAAARNQYSTLGQVQDGKHTRLTNVTGVDNVIGTLPGGAVAYVAGALISFFAVGTNTGPMTINYNGIGAKGLVAATGLPLAASAVLLGDFIIAYYDGTVFRILSAVRTSVPPEIFQLRTTGQQRPASGNYPALTIATPNSINIPAGTAWVIPPNSNSATDAVKVSWNAQTVALTYLNTSFSTTLMVDNTGAIIQYAGRVIGAGLRSAAVLGVVEHIGGTANTVITRPYIFGDDGYRGTDTATLLGNSIISGALVQGNSVSLLQMDISAGSIFAPGGSANTKDSPNVWPIAQQSNLPFRTLAGQNTLGAQILNAPVTQYDPNGAGAVTTIPNNGDTVVHRLYYLYGTFIWVFGQIIYSSVENALSFLEYDRTKFKASIFLAEATLVAEIVAQKNTTSLSNLAQAAIVAPGKINFSIGTPGGITEAPVDGKTYGRKNATWAEVLSAISPQIITSASITGAAPKLDMVMNPYAPGTVAYNVWANLNKWFAIEVTNPDDKAYLRSYNPANGALRQTVTYNMATGDLGLPNDLFVARDVVGSRNLALNGVGPRILGDMTNGGPGYAGRLALQTNVVNGNSAPSIIPNGTGTEAELVLWNSSLAADCGYGSISMRSAEFSIGTATVGTGTYVPLVFRTGPAGDVRMRINPTGEVGIGMVPIVGNFLSVKGSAALTGSLVVGYGDGGPEGGEIRFRNIGNTADAAQIDVDGANNLRIINSLNTNMLFYGNGAEMMRLVPSSNAVFSQGITLNPGSLSEVGKYIDFHGGEAVVDYDVRFTTVSFAGDGGGLMTMTAANFNMERNFNNASYVLRLKNNNGGNAAQTRFEIATSANELSFITKWGPGTAFPNMTEFKSGANGDQAMQIIGSVLQCPPVFLNTNAAAANVVVVSGGGLQRSTSSARYKDDIQDYDRPGLIFNQKMRPVTFLAKNDDSGERYAGLISEELADLGMDEFVSFHEGKPEGIHYGHLAAHFVKCINEQQAMIEQLAKRIAELEG